jgi:hypothetical protein
MALGAVGGEDVHTRHRNGLRLLVAMVVAVSAVPAFAFTASAGPSSKADAVSATVNWTLATPAPFAGTRFDGEYVPSLRRVFFLGFRTTGDVTDGSVWYYDVPTNTYVDTGVNMRVPVSNYQISMLQDDHGLGLYIFGGRDANAQIVTTVQVFYPATNTVARILSDPFPGTTPSGCVSLPAMGVATLQNKAYVLGGVAFVANGCVADENSAQTWTFDPLAPAGTRWSQGPNLNMARGYITPAVLGRRIYAIGGDENIAGSLFASSIVEAWAPPSGGWNNAAIADLPTICDEAQAYGFRTGPLAGGVVLAGCGQWPNAVADTYFYNQAANTWSLVGAFNENRRNHAGALIPRGGRQIMYILGGYGEASGFIDPIFSQENGEGAPAGGSPVRAGTSAGARGSVPTS